MSTITDALKRAAGHAAHEPAVGPQAPAADDRFPEALPAAAPPPRPAAAPVCETAVPVAAEAAQPQNGARRQRLLLWGAVAVAAVVLVGLLYSRLGRVVETPAAQAEPNVWREKIIDEREALLAELNLPEERLDGEESGEAAEEEAPKPEEMKPEAKQPQARQTRAAAAKRPQDAPPAPKPAARAPQRTAKLAPADDDDEEEEAADDDAGPVRAAPAPRRAAPAAPRQVVNPTAPASPIAPGFRPQPTTGPLSANQFAYNAAPQRVVPVTATPAPPPDQATELYRQGLEHEKGGRTEQAIALYRLVLERQPGRETVSLRLGNLLHRQGQLDEAARVFRQAVAAKDSAVLRNNLGGVLLAQKKLEEARAEFSAAAALDPKYADPHYNLACYHALAGRPQEGLAELEKAKALDPKVMESAATDHDLAALRALPEYKRLTE